MLDLFAGSGALGLEALSRGAAARVFVESDREACRTINANLDKLRLHGTVLCQDVLRALARGAAQPTTSFSATRRTTTTARRLAPQLARLLTPTACSSTRPPGAAEPPEVPRLEVRPPASTVPPGLRSSRR